MFTELWEIVKIYFGKQKLPSLMFSCCVYKWKTVPHIICAYASEHGFKVVILQLMVYVSENGMF